jgi:hypothetical protein
LQQFDTILVAAGPGHRVLSIYTLRVSRVYTQKNRQP